jgi:hypothetical protein
MAASLARNDSLSGPNPKWRPHIQTSWISKYRHEIPAPHLHYWGRPEPVTQAHTHTHIHSITIHIEYLTSHTKPGIPGWGTDPRASVAERKFRNYQPTVICCTSSPRHHPPSPRQRTKKRSELDRFQETSFLLCPANMATPASALLTSHHVTHRLRIVSEYVTHQGQLDEGTNQKTAWQRNIDLIYSSYRRKVQCPLPMYGNMSRGTAHCDLNWFFYRNSWP